MSESETHGRRYFLSKLVYCVGGLSPTRKAFSAVIKTTGVEDQAALLQRRTPYQLRCGVNQNALPTQHMLLIKNLSLQLGSDVGLTDDLTRNLSVLLSRSLAHLPYPILHRCISSRS